MKILKLEWRNIFSYGNKLETLDFGDEGKLWQLSGKSGAGKSSLLSLPKLLFYGVCEDCYGEKIKVGSVANRVNKNGYIRGTVQNGNDIYVIERTFSPQGIKLFKNDEPIDKANSKDLQTVIDTEILNGMPYHIFSNVVTLSLNSFKSFISMSPANKREIIDKIFSLEIINKVCELVKKDMKELGGVINNSNSQIYTLSQTLKTAKEELENIKKRNELTNCEQRLGELNEMIGNLNDKITVVDKLYAEQNTAYNEASSYFSSICSAESQASQMYGKQNAECASIQNQINLFNNAQCPTCGTPFSGDSFDHLRKDLNDKLSAATAALEDIKSKMSEIGMIKSETNNKLLQIRGNMDKIQAKRREIINLMNQYNVEKESITATMNASSESSSIEKIISDAETNKKAIEGNLVESNTTMALLNILSDAYSKDGIKQEMMNKYIPTLNEEIRDTLNALHFPYTLEFDNTFEAHMQEYGQEIETRSLSMGEHKKVDLAVLCSILKMIKRKYPQINLVCLDETLSSLDYESSADILAYLKQIANSMNMNIFIVSHTTLDENVFDVKLYAEKENGFTDLKWL